MSEVTDSRIEQVIFEPGEVLFFENEETFHFFVIQSGQVEISKTGSDGKKLLLGHVGEGSSIGEFAMLDHKPRSAMARALTTVHAAKVSEDAYKELITELPDWAVAVMRGMIERLRQMNDIIRRNPLAAEAIKAELANSEFTSTGIHAEDESPFLSTD